MTEAGLIYKWKEDKVNKLKSGGKGSGKTKEDGGPGAISLTHLQAAFFILYLGMTLSFFVYGAEKSCFYSLDRKLPD